MHKITWSSLMISFFVLMIGTLGSWLVSKKIFDHKVAFEVLQCSLLYVSIIFAIKILIYSKAKKYLFYQVIFCGILGMDLAWFLSCLLFPLLWFKSVNLFWKIALLCFYIFICVFNVRMALKKFEEKWEKFGIISFDQALRSGSKVLRWEEVLQSMRLTAIIFIPGMSEKFSDFVTVILFVLLMLGYSFRLLNPFLSMIALVAPCTVCAACCLQMSSYRFAEAKKIRHIERDRNIKLNSV